MCHVAFGSNGERATISNLKLIRLANSCQGFITHLFNYRLHVAVINNYDGSSCVDVTENNVKLLHRQHCNEKTLYFCYHKSM